jgi:predicted Rossmann fold flavoprotein
MNGRGLADYLRSWLEAQGVSFYFNSPMTDIFIQDGVLRGLEIKGKAMPASSAILACGGNTWPKTGSDGRVLGILEQAGHTILPLLPALAPLKTRESWPLEMKGISLKNVTVTITGNGKKLDQTRGGLLFTHFGLSGPAILDASHAAARGRHDKLETQVMIDLLPELDGGQIKKALEQQRQKTVANALTSLLPAQLAKKLGSEDYIKGLAPSTLEKLARALKETRLEIVDVLGKNHAMVSQGGVSLKEVNPRTMESKLIQGLYITGEMLDYHGRTGGFNLHAAFATGWLAGKS